LEQLLGVPAVPAGSIHDHSGVGGGPAPGCRRSGGPNLGTPCWQHGVAVASDLLLWAIRPADVDVLLHCSIPSARISRRCCNAWRCVSLGRLRVLAWALDARPPSVHSVPEPPLLGIPRLIRGAHPRRVTSQWRLCRMGQRQFLAHVARAHVLLVQCRRDRCKQRALPEPGRPLGHPPARLGGWVRYPSARRPRVLTSASGGLECQQTKAASNKATFSRGAPSTRSPRRTARH